MAKEVIATENTIVHDEALGIDRLLIGGQPVPPDLVDAYQGKTGKATSSDSAEEAEGDGDQSYDKQTVEQLKAEVQKRGLEVEGSGRDGNVVKADLVAALEAHDAE